MVYPEQLRFPGEGHSAEASHQGHARNDSFANPSHCHSQWCRWGPQFIQTFWVSFCATHFDRPLNHAAKESGYDYL